MHGRIAPIFEAQETLKNLWVGFCGDAPGWALQVGTLYVLGTPGHGHLRVRQHGCQCLCPALPCKCLCNLASSLVWPAFVMCASQVAASVRTLKPCDPQLATRIIASRSECVAMRCGSKSTSTALLPELFEWTQRTNAVFFARAADVRGEERLQWLKVQFRGCFGVFSPSRLALLEGFSIAACPAAFSRMDMTTCYSQL